ncbi:hypothetical protein HX049_11715 [Myroides odoratimimus]|uniref:hypothetical protein n=1 Tax=Myroides odoratimimus TaxID=76832 RepID=UPI002576E00C|nr:hypothetical protein [Myroides odoratimimus]MDM1397845.1 hypothetical protein [Myroides odoratimimus]
MDINDQIKQVLQKHKGFKLVKDSCILYGSLLISEEDSYEVEINFKNFPACFPIVHELDDRIPKKVERHIYSDTGSCCFTTRAKADIFLETQIFTLLDFIDKIVIPYFENNSYYEINGRYHGDEYSHNKQGVIEGYYDILGITDILPIYRLILNRLKGQKIKLKDGCYCGSKEALKKCNNGLHERKYRNFRKIKKDTLLIDCVTINQI